jgi:beta-glucanase (GH16 family)
LVRLRLLAVATALSTALVAAPAHGDTVRQAPAADTTVRASGPSRAASPLLRVGGRPRTRALLRFPVQLPAGATVTGVRLRLYAVTRRARTGYRVLALTGRRAATWPESVRARRAPRGGRRLGRRGGWSRRGYTTTVLRPDAVAGNGPVAVAVVTRSRARKRFRARESSRPPQLVVDYTIAARAPAPPATAVFSDEFARPAGTPPDPATWDVKTGGRWMNGGEPELQCYTARPENVGHDGLGHLAITARYEPGNAFCADGPNDYTSARLDTRGLRTFRYGRIEARIKLPTAAGSWPAWWMAGAVGTWPAAGEIDILEYRPGAAPAAAHHAIHADDADGAHWQQSFDALGAWTGGWHVFGVERRRDRITFRIDGAPTWTRTPADMPAGGRWPFNEPFGLLLNVAVGNWGGTPVPAHYPATMLVDWVRVTR